MEQSQTNHRKAGTRQPTVACPGVRWTQKNYHPWADFFSCSCACCEFSQAERVVAEVKKSIEAMSEGLRGSASVATGSDRDH